MVTQEIWKDVTGFEGFYQVSTLGRVRSLDRKVMGKDGFPRLHKGKIMSPGTTHGYKFVFLAKNGSNKQWYVHRLVASEFIPNPKNYPQINHKDEDRGNNQVNNLEWCTSKYNNNYGGHIQRGAEKLSVPVVCLDMFNMKLYEFPSSRAASDELGLDTGHVAKVLLNKSTNHKQYIFVRERDYTPELMRRKYIEANHKAVDIFTTDGDYVGRECDTVRAGKLVGVDPSAISKCLLGKKKYAKGYVFKHPSFDEVEI